MYVLCTYVCMYVCVCVCVCVYVCMYVSCLMSLVLVRADQLQPTGGPHYSLRTRLRAALLYTWGVRRIVWEERINQKAVRR